MKTARIVKLALLAALAAAGCAFTGQSYETSHQNLQYLRCIRGPQQITLAAFTASHPEQSRITCCKGRAVKLPWGKSFEEYIGHALMAELKAADLYRRESPAMLGANLDLANLEIDTPVRSRVATYPGARWTFVLTFRDQLGQTFTVRHAYEFKSGSPTPRDQEWCQAAADAFRPAVQETLEKLYHTEEFRRLSGAPAGTC